ncbi:hypothetical protein [Lactobacillus sp. LL6]|uniref:hypothetical protein n=1 Tax=Lactobacillus sp. LL6 TaxID=2596827 RepID=UPI001185FEC2|nr:hypothetical protein [Lactobacillus sp. LL6]TSO26965.1 hypothetical protein FOD82_08065 [Lactobacillus sp. LL6]
MTKRTKKIIVIGALIYFVLTTYMVLAAIKEELRPGLKFDVDNGIYMFLGVQPFGFADDGFITSMMPLLLIPVFSSFYIIFIKNNNGITNIIQRIGYKKYLQTSVLHVFSFASVFALGVQLYEIVLINWFYSPFAFTSNSLVVSQRPHFTSNSLIHLIAYLITSSVGWGIFAVLIFAIGLFIKKNAIYLISGAVVGLALMLFFALFPINSITVFVANITTIFNLIAPGQVSIHSQFPPLGLPLTWIIIAIIYASVSFLLIKLWYKKQLRGA